MKKATRVLFLAAFLFGIFSVNASASEADKLTSEFFSVIGGSPRDLEKIGIDAVLSELLSALSSGGGALGKFAALALGGAMAIALSSLLAESRYAGRAVSAAVTSLLFLSLVGVLGEARDVLLDLTALFSSISPIMSAITLAGGGTSAAATEALGVSLVLSLVSGGIVPLLLPLAIATAPLSAISALSPETVGGVGSRIKGVYMWLMGIVTAVLVGTLSLQSVIASAKDGAAMRAAKYSASGLIPVVGGTVSASLGTLGAGLSYAKSIVGAEAVWVMVSLAASPLVMMLAYRFIISVSVMLLELVGAPDGARAYGALATSLDLSAAAYTVSVLLFIFEIILFMKSGVAVLG